MRIGKYNVVIYGDGKFEYEGYYLMVIDEFDAQDMPTGNKQVAYIRGDSRWVELLSEDEIDAIFKGHRSARYVITNEITLYEE